jgi:TRAP-type C4-dicarboxylate transport system permease small subunit
VDLHVGSLVVRGMPPWAQASNLPPVARALMLAATGWMAACAGAYAALRGAIRSRIGVLAVGSAGPLAALGLLRIYERAGTAAWTFASVPIAGSALAFAFAIAAQRLGRLRDPNHAASTRTRV